MTNPIAVLMTVGVASDLYEVAGEDGPKEATAFYVVAEDVEGNRWAHVHRFLSPVMGLLGAQAGAMGLCNRIRAAYVAGKWAGAAGNGHWQAVRPAYGSPAYSANWRAYEAQSELAEGHFVSGTPHEMALKEAAGSVP